MGNIYTYTECDDCRKAVDTEYQFMVHRDPTPIDTLAKKGYRVGQIAAHFCGYCGGYIDIMAQKELTSDLCGCGNFRYQGWNYEDDKDKWVEPEGWWKDEG